MGRENAGIAGVFFCFGISLLQAFRPYDFNHSVRHSRVGGNPVTLAPGIFLRYPCLATPDLAT
jgi:hypothetical protein